MSQKPVIMLSVLLVAAVALVGCGMFGGESAGQRPTPTLPLATPILVEPTLGAPTAAPSGGAGLIGGAVFNDSNGNGAKDEGEPLIAGVQVMLAGGSCPGAPLAMTATTAGTPSYEFRGLAPSEYCVSVDPKVAQNANILGGGAWTFPQATPDTVTQQLQLQPGESRTDVSFGWTFTPLVQITGTPEPPPMLPTPTPGVPVQPTGTAAQPTGAPAPTCTYRASYIADVTIPDGTVVPPSTQFIKTWRIKNTGNCPIGPGTGLHQLQFVGGSQMEASPLVEMANVIQPGAEGDVSVALTSPAQNGTYKSNWKLRADNGALIGVGPSNVPLYAQIVVRPAPPPTAVPPPTGAPTAAPQPVQPIQFAPGATEAEVQGQLPANGVATYSINVQGGQSMSLSLSSNSSSAKIAVKTPAGAPLPPQRGNPEGTFWQGTIPATGDYIIQVLAGSAAASANYSLNVVVPQRISFALGTDSAAVAGTTSQGRIVTFLLKANAGQTMTANLIVPPDTAGLTIYGLDDGQPLVRAQSGATSFNGTLPGTQDYVIQVVPFGQGTVNFTLQVRVQ